MYFLTKESLAEILKANKTSIDWLIPLQTILPKYGIDTQLRCAAFLAQTAHESADFTVLKENLNYSVAGLKTIFKKYFPTDDIANQYARKPEAIANKVYANRMGNGDEKSGDGWKFRGRSLIQLTGKNGYKNASIAIYGDERLLTNPDLLLEKDAAILAACWFWNINKLNDLADKGDIVSISKRINGGVIGMSQRVEKYNIAINSFKKVLIPSVQPYSLTNQAKIMK